MPFPWIKCREVDMKTLTRICTILLSIVLVTGIARAAEELMPGKTPTVEDITIANLLKLHGNATLLQQQGLFNRKLYRITTKVRVFNIEEFGGHILFNGEDVYNGRTHISTSFGMNRKKELIEINNGQIVSIKGIVEKIKSERHITLINVDISTE